MILQGPVALPPPTPPPGVDLNFLISQLFPLIGAVTALIVGGAVLYAFVKSDLAAAIAERIRAGIHRRKPWIDQAEDVGSQPRVAELEDRVGALQGQVAELAERLDFAERLLARGARDKLRAGE